MKGTIRLIAGLLLVMGGVGGMETNTTEVLPLNSLLITLFGLAIMGWGVLAINREERQKEVDNF